MKKTTFLKLLLRFYDADSGEIRINGKRLDCYSREELTSMFGVCLQNDFIYADTIKENICFGREIADEDIIKAAEFLEKYI